MIKCTVEVTSTDNTDVLKKLLKDLSEMQVYVGIPEASGRKSLRKEEIKSKGEALSNAQIAFINTHGARASSMREEMDEEVAKGSPYSAAHQMFIAAHGSPLYRIPPRPIIEPAIEAPGNKERIANSLAKAATAVLEGNPGEAERHLNLAGQKAVNAVRNWFDDPRNGWAANAPATVKAKGSDAPLIDTGQMRKSITYIIKKTT